jgi:hypothetical protein
MGVFVMNKKIDDEPDEDSIAVDDQSESDCFERLEKALKHSEDLIKKAEDIKRKIESDGIK